MKKEALKNLGCLNEPKMGDNAYKVIFTPKGTKEKAFAFVYATSRLNASSWMINNKIYGTQHEIIDWGAAKDPWNQDPEFYTPEFCR